MAGDGEVREEKASTPQVIKVNTGGEEIGCATMILAAGVVIIGVLLAWSYKEKIDAETRILNAQAAALEVKAADNMKPSEKGAGDGKEGSR